MYLINSKNFTLTYLNSVKFIRRSAMLPYAHIFLFCAILITIFLNAAPVMAVEAVCRSFSGSIYDMRTVEPIAGVTVSLSAPGADLFEARTDENGKYIFNEVPAGKYMVKVSKPGYISDSIKLNLSKSYERYDTSIESERDNKKRNSPDYEKIASDDDEWGTGSAQGDITLSPSPMFSPKDNIYGVSGFYQLPDCRVLPLGAYRVSYGVMRSRRTSGPSTPYSESNYSTAVSYGLSENVEMSVFAFQHFKDVKPTVIPAVAPALPTLVPAFFSNRTGISLKYCGELKYKQNNQIFPYSLVYSHYNDGSDEVAIPIEFDSELGKLYFIPTYISRLGGNVHFNIAYNKPLFIDHRKLSYMMEFIQDDKHRWNVINGGFRLEFKNDSCVNLFVLSDTGRKRLTTGISGSILFK